jgi:hypothetical protein
MKQESPKYYLKTFFQTTKSMFCVLLIVVFLVKEIHFTFHKRRIHHFEV